MPVEPPVKRAIAFIDGQNLYHAARTRFASNFPDYDPAALAEAVCSPRGWHLVQTRFYTGMHARFRNKFWHTFWSRKLGVMGRQEGMYHAYRVDTQAYLC
jgi:hypothetical protein